ncbi:Na+/H+ antiporter [Actinocorallia populi]|uniref:Na+/H+ antiporter n=1 Tax=Actinocorallia populi TaxID=2079200 RepID=UPI000D0944F3|nr:Na+/H+ antiporter [Actinocorallia populi]
MLGLELVVVLGVAVLACNVAGRRFRIAPPVLLLVCGVVFGFVPALRQVHLPPDAVLLLFLPALLYWESLTTSPREIRRGLRGIALMGTVLVILTAGAVAVAAHALGLPWGPAWVLGAAVAPTDATAVGVLARMLPRHDVTMLRGESLVNDGTALVVYGLAVGITVGQERLGVAHVTWLFLVAYLGGAAAGALTAWAGVRVRRRLDDPLLGSAAMLLIPFTAFLLAEAIEASGVLAVVVCGLIMSQAGPRVGQADARLQTVEFFSLSAFLLNGSLFVLVGMEWQSAVRGLTSLALVQASVAVGVVFAVLVGVRFAFLFGSAFLARLLDRRPRRRPRRVRDRARVVSGISGFRGAVTLAAALAVPSTLASGAPFPGRDVIVFVAAGVIVATLVVQGLLLPGVVRWARLPHDTSVAAERHLAETLAVEEALTAMPWIAQDLGTDPEVLERLRREYETHLLILRSTDADSDADDGADAGLALRLRQDDTALRLALIARKRAAVLRLRDERRIDDTVLRQIQAALDLEEIRLSRRPPSG